LLVAEDLEIVDSLTRIAQKCLTELEVVSR
jgi:hypothetical protein